MKCLLGLFLFWAAFNTNAASLNCAQTKGWRSVGMWATANVSGQYQSAAERAIFDSISFNYKVYWDPSLSGDELWAQGNQTYSDLPNEPNYSPRKYKNHMKFQVWVNGSGAGSGYGDLDLIVPEKEMLAMQPASFPGYLIMTYIDDHWGGTVKMDCVIE